VGVIVLVGIWVAEGEGVRVSGAGTVSVGDLVSVGLTVGESTGLVQPTSKKVRMKMILAGRSRAKIIFILTHIGFIPRF
jgi:hypothetical protein